MCGSGRIICREFNEETNGSHLKLSQVKNRKLQQESSLGEGDAGQGVKAVTGEGARNGSKGPSKRKTLCAGIPHNNFTDNEYIGKMRQDTHAYTYIHTRTDNRNLNKCMCTSCPHSKKYKKKKEIMQEITTIVWA